MLTTMNVVHLTFNSVYYSSTSLFFFIEHQLKNRILGVVSVESEMMCAHHCTSIEQLKCKSFNYIFDRKVKKNCELNSEAASSMDEASLVPREGASYFERIKKGTVKYSI
jgi:hypothetical protein